MPSHPSALQWNWFYDSLLINYRPEAVTGLEMPLLCLLYSHGLGVSSAFFFSEPRLALQACNSGCSSQPKRCVLRNSGLLDPGCVLGLLGFSNLNIIPEALGTLLELNVLLRINRMITMQINAPNNMSTIRKLTAINVNGCLPSFLALTSSNESKVTHGSAWASGSPTGSPFMSGFG